MPGEGGESAEVPKIGDRGVVCVGVCFMCVCVYARRKWKECYSTAASQVGDDGVVCVGEMHTCMYT